MLGTSARLLRLLSLLQSRRAWTGPLLCERLEIEARTLRRDVDRLRSLGYPVHSSSGVAGGYRLGAGQELPPLLLDDDEALAVSLGLHTAAQGNVSGMEEIALRALGKLEQVLPARLQRRLSALHAAIVPLAAARGPAIDARVLTSLAAASRDRERLRFEYRAENGAVTRRHVEPLGLVHTAARWYLVAWDLGREDWRTFRVDRICGQPAKGTRFAAREPPPGGLAAYVARSVSLAVYPVQARVVLHAPIARMMERISPSTGMLERIDASRCRLHAGAPSLDALAVLLSMLGVDFTIEAPLEARVHLRKLAERAYAASGAHAPRARGRARKRR